MKKISMIVTEEKWADIKDAMNGLYPCPMINNGTEEEPNMVRAYTEDEWVHKCFEYRIQKSVARYKEYVAKKLAKVSEDTALINSIVEENI